MTQNILIVRHHGPLQLVAIAILVAGVLPLALLRRATPPVAAASQTTPGTVEKMIPVGESTLFLSCRGNSGPMVVFESGAGRTSTDWATVQERVAGFARACAYDRAGLGRSVPAREHASGKAIVDDLHALLKAADLPPPYILVAHSLAGYYARTFASHHGKALGGLVLVDPAHEEFWRRSKGLMPDAHWDGWGRGEAGLRQDVSESKLPDVPVVVLTSGQAGIPAAPGYDIAAMNAIWKDVHIALARSVPRGKHIDVPTSSHFIQRDQPSVVADAIRWVVDNVHTPRR